MAARRSILVGALVILALLLPAGAADAAAHVTLSLDFENIQVTAGAGIPYSYTAAHVPRGDTVALQRQYGAVYKRVTFLRQSSGHGTAPGLPMGRYGYRLLLRRGKKVLTKTSPIYIYSYGTVTLTQLCAATSSRLTIANCSSGTVPVGSGTFDYAASDTSGNADNTGAPALKAAGSKCRSGQISYTLANSADPSAEADIEVDQPGSNPQSDATPYGTVSTLKFVTPSPTWDVVFWENPAGQTVYWNGSFSCWTATGQ